MILLATLMPSLAFGKVKRKHRTAIKDAKQLPMGIWRGTEGSDTIYTVSFCPGDQYFQSKRMGEHTQKVHFSLAKDKFGLEISMENAVTNEWAGLSLLYVKSKQQLYFWGDNGESELTMADAIPMKQISTKCIEEK